MTDYSALPAPVLAKLLSLEESVDFFAQRVAKTQAGIESARHRLSGGFHKDSEYRDSRSASGTTWSRWRSRRSRA
jgi:hypothetical protein